MQRLRENKSKILILAVFVIALFAVIVAAPKALYGELPDDAVVEEILDAQLGELVSYVTPEERDAARQLLLQILPMQEMRQRMDRYEYLDGEEDMIRALNKLYVQYTNQYLGESGFWPYSPIEDVELGRFKINHEDYSLEFEATDEVPSPPEAEEMEQYQTIWEWMLDIMPEDAFRDFTYVNFWTDGPYETLAYVAYTDPSAMEWEIYVDVQDAIDSYEYFTRTILHEYTHYVTLNGNQVTYTDQQTASTYNEMGMVSNEDSYINRYYERFWKYILDDRLIDMASTSFFQRHVNEFVTSYAATDPSEDICESFASFVFNDPPEGDSVVEQKRAFFYEYDEFVQMRATIRKNIGLDD